MTGVAEAAARLEERCRRAEYEYPRLAAPDGTVAVPIGDLRLLLNAQGIVTPAGAEPASGLHPSGFDPTIAGELP